jgi:hypothetical protein
MPPYEGQTGTAPDGTRVVYRGGKVYPINGPDASNRASSLSPPEQKTIADLRVAAQNIRGAREQAEEFGKLNREVATGGVFGFPGVSEMVGAVNPKVSAMQGLSNAMISGMHVTPGPMTDADAKIYKSTIPNPNLPGPANQRLRADIGRKEEVAAARVAFFERWAANKGTLNGAEQEFNRWLTGWQAKKAKPPQVGAPGASGGAVKYLGTE